VLKRLVDTVSIMKALVLLGLVAMATAGTVQPGLLAKVRAGEVSSFIIELPQVTDEVDRSAAFQSMPYGDERVNALVSMLQGLTEAAQSPYVTQLKALGLEFEQFWGSNIILVKNVDEAALNAIGKFTGDFVLREEVTVSMFPVVRGAEVNISQTYQWGVSNIRAPQAWARCDGSNQIVAIIDTGVHQSHTALSAGYSGAWRDPYYNTANPTDQQGHGSHCAGSAVGRANGVGVAPGARWAACRGLNHQGSGTEANLVTCGQWVLTANPRPTVVSNSWGGGQASTFYNSVISSWNNAGITPVFAIGNAGAACGTANSPGDQNNVISVGATTNTNNGMATFSSRGPARTSNLLKPEVSAPGSNIVSCGTGSSNYVTMSGTSMATPHVAGAVALVRQCLNTNQLSAIKTALYNSAAHPTLTSADRNCGLPTPGQDFPNCAYGYGKIDVGRAVGA